MKLRRPSGLGSSVILSSAFSLLTLPSTWQDFLLHSWLYNPRKPRLPIPPFLLQPLQRSYAWTHRSVRARPPRALAWCDSGFVWKYEVCVEHFQGIYVVAAVTACQIYKAASDPLTRRRCVAAARSELTQTSQDYYARLFSCAPHILGSLYDFAPCNKQVTTSLCVWSDTEHNKRDTSLLKRWGQTHNPNQRDAAFHQDGLRWALKVECNKVQIWFPSGIRNTQ